ncbi:MAG TPA: filamentous hemagglutinin N-terminal domain-containing protein [Gallionella sp.]|nr:filamentous hemagglutinin N-terminal domain-containing protein [Gallionella sp.]
MHETHLFPKLRIFQHSYWTGLMLGLSFCFPSQLLAAITTDGTVGLATNLMGPNYAIPAALGSQVGSNLFHSFSVFNVNTGESATFSGPNGIANIIARVTGGASTIDGGLNSTIPLANLVLVNPSGIAFGPNASLNVGGAFYASTANYVRLADGGVFDATAPANSVLTTAPLASFGFLGAVAPITVQGSILAVPEGQTFSLIGGDINVTGGLTALGGAVDMASVASAGEVGLAHGLDVSGFATLGAVSINAPIDVSAGVAGQGGSIYILGGQITTGAAAKLTAYTLNSAGGGIVIRATDSLTMNQSFISTDTGGAGQGGSINLNAASVVLDNTTVNADTWGAGNAGFVTVDAGRLDILNGSYISSDAAMGTGNGGIVSLNAATMVLDNAKVYADTYGTGNAGFVTVTANQLDVLNGSWISSDAMAGSTGNGGNVSVHAAGNMTVANALITTKTKEAGQGGSINLNAASMVLNNASVYADTYGAGNAGAVTVTANQLDVLNGSWISSDALTGSAGNGGSVYVEVAGNMTVANGLITSKAQGTGLGGSIFITAANSITLSSGAKIKSDSTADGSAGFVSITTSELKIDGSTISSTASGWGDGGFIAINVDKLNLANTGVIDTTISNTNPQGWGGFININAATSVALSGGAQIKSDTAGDSLAGSISLTTPDLNIDGGMISSTASGWGDGGFIAINVDKLNLANTGVIDATTSSTNPQGWGGYININAATSVALSGGAQIKSDTAGDGHAGSISLTTSDLNIEGGTISSTASGWGDGGFIAINVDKLNLANTGVIDATTSSANPQGWGGYININAATSVALSGGAQIKSDTAGDGHAGSISITAPNLNIDGGAISSAAGTYGSTVYGWGAGGGIVVSVDKLALSNRGSIDVGAFENGKGGHVNITAGTSIDLSSGAFIISDTRWQGMGGYISLSAPVINIDGGYVDATVYGQGPGGAIVVNADRLTLSNRGSIDASSFDKGSGGDITLNATSSISLYGGSQIASRSESAGTAGQIRIDAGRTLSSENSSITTEALLSDGGNISLVSRDLIYLNYSDLTATVKSGVGNGGNIFIDPQFVVLNNSNITANAFGGNGGNIQLIANNFFQSANSTVTASSQLGVSGSVSLNTHLTDLSGSLASLPMVYLDTTGLIKQRCAAQLDGKISTFVLAGRGGIPQEPTGLMPSASLLAGASGPQPGSGVLQVGSQYSSLSEPGFGCVN